MRTRSSSAGANREADTDALGGVRPSDRRLPQTNVFKNQTNVFLPIRNKNAAQNVLDRFCERITLLDDEALHGPFRALLHSLWHLHLFLKFRILTKISTN